MSPAGIAGLWIAGLLSLGVWVGAAFCLLAWGQGRSDVYLAFGLLLVFLGSGGGRAVVRLFVRKGNDEPRHERSGVSSTIRRPDGTEIHVEVSGNQGGPTVVLTHGWGANSTEWFYLRRQLASRCRLVAWDLPGLGKSKASRDRNFEIDKLAGDLMAVLDETAGDDPVILLGHSIGGMILLRFAKLYPNEIGGRVAGMVLAHTTHTDPLLTIQGGAILRPLRKPLLIPICRLTIAFSPLLWFVSVLAYLNGSLQIMTRWQLFSAIGTWAQIDFIAKYVLQLWPAHYARGAIAMMRYEAADVPPTLDVPVLVVAGDLDKMCLPFAGQQIEAAAPDAQLLTLAPAGHLGLFTSHEEFGQAVKALIDRCAGERHLRRGQVLAAEPVTE